MAGDEGAFAPPLGDAGADPAAVGRTGAAAARLAAAGLPVTPGFHVTTGAYRRYMELTGLRGPVLTAVRSAASPAEAAAAIAEMFARHHLPTELDGAVRWAAARISGRDERVSVRASHPDAPGEPAPPPADFWDVPADGDLPRAVRDCWASLWSADRIAHRERAGVPHEDAAVAVLVQKQLLPDVAGVLSTVAPVTGSPGRVVINAVRGAGATSPDRPAPPETIAVARPSGRVIGRTGPAGRLLSDARAAELAALGARVEEAAGEPAEVQWALEDGAFTVLEAHPLEGLPGGDAVEAWNDTPHVDHLWTAAGLGEAVPGVMTPCTWSLVQMFMGRALPAWSVRGYRAYGRVGGRLYTDASRARALGLPVRVPPGVRVPRAGVPTAAAAVGVLEGAWGARTGRRRAADLRDGFPARCEALRARIADVRTPGELRALWHEAVRPAFLNACRMVEAAGYGRAGDGVRDGLARLVGGEAADAMLAGVRAPGGEPLAGSGPLDGLARLARGDLDAAAYVRRWGHRGPYEFEVAEPRPAEDPGWLPQARAAGADAAVLLERRRAASRDAWRLLRERHPRKAAAMRRRLARWARAEDRREGARSELARMFWVLRAYVVRAGELTLQGDDVFHLTIGEVLGLLRGDDAALRRVPVRRRTYERYRALPPYPALIRGAFDPFAPRPGRDGASAARISGLAGAAGRAAGPVRVAASPADAAGLRDGEILVTTATNAGWAPLFPRAAAVVTEADAPASHAAALARDLGIPAVVGALDATARLRTGDRVEVDGTGGTVTRL
ncbi:PEP/pyruvate-binding domain-containing protein [Actinomadura parmotrematis]|uniref:Pyruvate, phosphate dikinase n=1 Tax=Actinomadura parmotrematis TaxID=2864039 RepID=A0ABS7FYN0_9ACTN|nr:PEP/pyruvate-binding domain-containing protein [Actinomadura parmotrematis]MBW8485381.1 hypothetical protein [Actinomadura parmotrematis]